MLSPTNKTSKTLRSYRIPKETLEQLKYIKTLLDIETDTEIVLYAIKLMVYAADNKLYIKDSENRLIDPLMFNRKKTSQKQEN